MTNIIVANSYINTVLLGSTSKVLSVISCVGIDSQASLGLAAFDRTTRIFDEYGITGNATFGLAHVTFTNRIIFADGFASINKMDGHIVYVGEPIIPPVSTAIARPVTYVTTTTAKKKDARFSDLLLTPFIHPNTGDVTRAFDDQAIKGSLRNIVLTNTNELRYDDTKFGADVSKQLFKPGDFATAALIEQKVKFAVKTYEPRVRVDEVRSNFDEANNSLEVTLVYTIVSASQKSELKLTLDRVR